MKNKKSNNILKDAINIVYDRSSEKANEYGPFDESMASAAKIATELTGKEITTLDFYKCMMALKLARLKYSSKEDTFLDLVAYIGAAHKRIVENPVWIEEAGKINKDVFSKLNFRGSDFGNTSDHAVDALGNCVEVSDFIKNKNLNEKDEAEIMAYAKTMSKESNIEKHVEEIRDYKYTPNYSSNEFDKNQTND